MTVHCNTQTHTVHLIRAQNMLKHEHNQLFLVHTCAPGEVGNVTVFEDFRVLEHLSQPSQT